MKRSGVADLPLHGGRVPAWLAERMTTLGTAITEAVIHHYGTSAFLSRLSDPFWFQALGSVMGMDWHSSGITTSVMGALKRGLNPRASELGIHVCGGRGRHSRRTPDELRALGDRLSLDADGLVRTSRLAARIDNNAIADGFQIYLHTFVLASTGEWAVVQQGLNAGSGTARRYHWHSAAVRDFVTEPHTGIVGESQGIISNLVDVLLLEQLGPRTLQSLALVAEVIHGTPARFQDPARFSFAHGGKDGHPFPVPLKTYDETIDVLRRSLDLARVQQTDKVDGLRRLDRFVRDVGSMATTEVDFDAAIAHERRISPSLGGRTVFDDRRPQADRRRRSLAATGPRQPRLF